MVWILSGHWMDDHHWVLPLIHCSIRWQWDKGLFQSPKLGPQTWAYFLVTGWVPEWAGLALNYGWEGLELSPGLFQVSQPRMRSAYLALEAWIDVPPTRSMSGLNWSLTMAGKTRAEGMALYKFPEAQIWVSPVRSLCFRTAHGPQMGRAGA